MLRGGGDSFGYSDGESGVDDGNEMAKVSSVEGDASPCYVCCNGKMVVLHDGTEPRAARVWEVVLGLFRSMGATDEELVHEAWKLRHNPVYHHTWAFGLPEWVPFVV